jgi:hypothetical protein
VAAVLMITLYELEVVGVLVVVVTVGIILSVVLETRHLQALHKVITAVLLTGRDQT